MSKWEAAWSQSFATLYGCYGFRFWVLLLIYVFPVLESSRVSPQPVCRSRSERSLPSSVCCWRWGGRWSCWAAVPPGRHLEWKPGGAPGSSLSCHTSTLQRETTAVDSLLFMFNLIHKSSVQQKKHKHAYIIYICYLFQEAESSFPLERQKKCILYVRLKKRVGTTLDCGLFAMHCHHSCDVWEVKILTLIQPHAVEFWLQTGKTGNDRSDSSTCQISGWGVLVNRALKNALN